LAESPLSPSKEGFIGEPQTVPPAKRWLLGSVLVFLVVLL